MSTILFRRLWKLAFLLARLGAGFDEGKSFDSALARLVPAFALGRLEAG